MKEIKTLLADPVKIEKQAQQEKQVKFLGKIKPHRGHKIWEVNLENGTIKLAALEGQTVDFNQAAKKAPGSSKKLMAQPGCRYIAALNKKNVLKKLHKLLMAEIKAGYNIPNQVLKAFN
jgi:hypothetical protein